MPSASASPYSHTLIEAGVDWITATAPRGLEFRSFREESERLIDSERAAGVEVYPATLRDYTGHRGSHFFVGSRQDDRVIVASAGVAARAWETVARSARNVSRLDLQASVWTEGEQPSLARHAYQRLRRSPATRGRPRGFTLIQTHPKGETLNVGKRQSDQCGRLYDWSTAHKAGPEKTVWRYEVEFKRRAALAHTRALLGADDARTLSAQLVHRWFEARNVPPYWQCPDRRLSNVPSIEGPTRDTLNWFESSVSKTITKAIARHGLEAVILSLGLSALVEPIKKGATSNGINTGGTLPRKADRGVARPSNRDGLSLHDQQPDQRDKL